jgi:monoamine oxidase
VPLGVLRASSTSLPSSGAAHKITLDPELPPWKEDVYTRLGYSSSTAVVLQYSSPWWRVGDTTPGFAPGQASQGESGSTAPSPFIALLPPSAKAEPQQGSGQPEPSCCWLFEDVGNVDGQPVLVARILGSTPSSIDSMSDSQLQTAALYALAEALAAASGKGEEAGVPRSPVSSVCLRWSSCNPWCPGGATSPGAQPLATDLQAVAAPLKQTLLFAGEGGSDGWHGVRQGCVQLWLQHMQSGQVIQHTMHYITCCCE